MWPAKPKELPTPVLHVFVNIIAIIEGDGSASRITMQALKLLLDSHSLYRVKLWNQTQTKILQFHFHFQFRNFVFTRFQILTVKVELLYQTKNLFLLFYNGLA